MQWIKYSPYFRDRMPQPHVLTLTRRRQQKYLQNLIPAKTLKWSLYHREVIPLFKCFKTWKNKPEMGKSLICEQLFLLLIWMQQHLEIHFPSSSWSEKPHRPRQLHAQWLIWTRPLRVLTLEYKRPQYLILRKFCVTFSFMKWTIRKQSYLALCISDWKNRTNQILMVCPKFNNSVSLIITYSSVSSRCGIFKVIWGKKNKQNTYQIENPRIIAIETIILCSFMNQFSKTS